MNSNESGVSSEKTLDSGVELSRGATDEVTDEQVDHYRRHKEYLRNEQTGMHKKEILFLNDGVDFLYKKFGDSVELTLGDVAGVGVANELLCRPDEGHDEARRRVDTCLTLFSSVADEVFGSDASTRPFEIVRVGGDEIVFLVKQDDERLADFFRHYSEAKKKYLIEDEHDGVGQEVYDAAKRETNIKAQMKLITKEPGFAAGAASGDVAQIDAWICQELGNVAFAQQEGRFSDHLRMLAEKRLELIPKEEWVELLDLYRSSPYTITLGPDTQQDKLRFMTQIARADADIAWKKGHPGVEPETELAHDDHAIHMTALKYHAQAQGIELTAHAIREKEDKIARARAEQEFVNDEHRKVEAFHDEERLKKEIIRLETVDPGTGAIRFESAKSKRISDIVEVLPQTPIQVIRMDVPYFGVYNNHYDYATADQMMRKLADVCREHLYGTIVRDGGSLAVVRPQISGQHSTEGIESALNAIVQRYAEPDNEQARMGLRNEVLVKQAITRQQDEFGTVVLHPPYTYAEPITATTTLANVLEHVL
jgi:GGDEF domain-containing protein